MSRRTREWPIAATVALTATALCYAVADAQGGSAGDNSIPPSLTGGCTASASIAGYGGIDPAVSGGVYTVPKSGSASYTGSIPVEGEDRSTSGEVQVNLPLGLPSIPIKSWGGDDTDASSDSGTVTWDIPSLVPGNVEITVSGYHQDEGVRCEGSIVVKLDGGGIGSQLGLASIGLTVLALGAVAWAATPAGKGSF